MKAVLQTLPLQRSLRIILIVLVLSLFVVMVLFFEWYADGGVAIGESYRILQGEVLYQDFHSFWMPVTNWLLTGWMRVIGDTIVSIQLLAGLIYLLICISIFAITKSLTQSINGALISVILFLVVSVFPSVNHNWCGLLASLFIVYRFIKRKRKDRAGDWLNLGLLVGCAATIIIWQAGMLLLAFSIIVLQAKIGNKKKIGWLGRFLLGAVIPLGLLIVLFFIQGRGIQFIDNTLVFPLSSYLQAHARLPASPLLLPTVCVYLFLLLQYRRKGADVFQDQTGVLLLVGFLFLQFGILAPTPDHIVFGYAFLIPLVLHNVLSDHRQLIQGVRAWIVVIFLAGILAVGSLKVFIIQEAAYKLIVTNRSYVLASQKYQEMLRLIDQALPANKRACAVFPWAPELYYLATIRPTTRFTYLGPEYYRPSIQDEIIQEMKQVDLSCVLYFASVNPIAPLSPTLIRQYLYREYRLEHGLFNNKSRFPADGIWFRP